jgi:hypothetical protein
VVGLFVNWMSRMPSFTVFLRRKYICAILLDFRIRIVLTTCVDW